MPVTAFSGTNQLYGTFREETGVLLGDPYGVGYKDQLVIAGVAAAHETDDSSSSCHVSMATPAGLQRHHGKQFAAPFPPKGTDQDGLLDKATKLTVEVQLDAAACTIGQPAALCQQLLATTAIKSKKKKKKKRTTPGDHYQEPRDLAKEVGSHRQIHGKPFVPGSGPKDRLYLTAVTYLTVSQLTYLTAVTYLTVSQLAYLLQLRWPPMRSRCGSGSLHGIFGPASGQLDTDASLGSRSPNKLLTASLDGKRSIYVNPSKKGTYGYPLQDRSIGQTRYDFIPDEYMRGRILDREMKREARAKVPKPFLATSVTNKSPLTVAAIGPATKLAARGGSAPSDNRKPWKASNPAPRGRGYGALSAIEYIAAPPQMPLFHKEAVKPFRPGGGPYSRLSMWPINPFQYAPRPAPSNEFTLLA
ncbi:hypothetical protein QJQ45_002669 [Haematococcus lacustris]|nr:hypothetical protein QJQ45_002669 [Haematococcus lacustris]